MTLVLLLHDAAGAIVSYLSCPEGALVETQDAPEGGGIVVLDAMPDKVSDFAAANYVLAGVVTAKKVLPIATNKTSFLANGLDSVVISGVPAGAVALVYGALDAGPVTVNDGNLVITSTKAGAINCTITNTPANLPWSVALNAT